MDWVLTHRLKIVGGAAVVFGLAYYFHTRWNKRARTTDLWLVSEVQLVELMRLIRKRFSKLFAKRQAVWRAQRRSLGLGSPEYFEFVRKCRFSLSGVLQQAIDQVLNEEGCYWTVYDDSVRMYRSQHTVKEALYEMRLPLNHGPVSDDLTLDLLQEILNYFTERLHSHGESGEASPSLYCLIEDEIHWKFGFEIEEVERAFDKLWEYLPEFDLLMQSIRESHLVDSVPSVTECS